MNEQSVNVARLRPAEKADLLRTTQPPAEGSRTTLQRETTTIVNNHSLNPAFAHLAQQTRRHFFGRSATGIGTAALASLMTPEAFGGEPQSLGLPGLL